MQDFTSLRHITIGQYLPGDSLVHRLDPRTKITLVLLLSIAMTVNTSYMANLLLLGTCLVLIAAAGISMGYVLNGIRPAIPFILVLALLQLLFYGNAPLAGQKEPVVFLAWGPVIISSAGVQLVLVSLARFLDLMILVSILTNTTQLASLSYGLEDMLRPFRRLGLPAHEISLVGTIALRFVPILAEQLERIIQAQASRGADLGGGSKWRFIKTTRSVITLIVPLFLDAFRRAEDLIVAMEARCYQGGRGRTRLVQLHLTRMDGVVLFGTLLFTVLLVVFRLRFPW